ncbi:MAG: MATE family efflux transporter [Acutalibacteraceae bacterium]
MNKKITLFSLTWPILIENILFMLLGIIDVYALSTYDDVASASVNTANQIISICNILFAVTSNASAVIISQNLGAGNRQKASKTAAIAISFNLILGIVVSLVLAVFSRQLMSALGATGKILDFGSEYLMIVGGFMFTQALLNSMMVIFRNHGYTRVSMYVTAIMNVLNTILDLTFVMGWFGMPVLGIFGVAIATTFSRIVGLVIIAVLFFKKVEKFSFFKLLKPVPLKDFAAMMKIGIPSAFESLNYNVSQLVVTAIALAFLTENEYIAKSYLQNIASLFFIFSLSIGQGSQIMTSHLVGNKNFDGAYKSGWKAMGIGFSVSVLMSIIGILLRYQIIGIFTDNPEVILIGGSVICINIVLEMGRSSNLIIINSLRGAGDVYFPTIVAIFSMWIISTLGSYILAVPCGLGLIGMWIAFAADECFRGILMLFRWHGKKWTKKAVV